MKYGICSDTNDYSWNITHGNIVVGDEEEMYTNVVLIRTQSIKEYGQESSVSALVNQLMALSDDNFCIKGFTISVRAKEIYYWRPKETRVEVGEVVNYNAPCDDWDEARELRGCQGTFSCSGLGDPSCSMQNNIVRLADKIMNSLQDVGGFHLKSDTHQFAIRSWESSTLSGSFTTSDNMKDNELSSMSISISGLEGIDNNYFVMTSKTQMFPDKYPTKVNFKDVCSGLKTQANVGCS